MWAGVSRTRSSRWARKSGLGRYSRYASRTGSGISIWRSVLTSWPIRAIGKSGARSAGPIGWPVPGWRTAAGGIGRSATMLYQARGIWSSESRNLVCRSSPRGSLISVVLLGWSADGGNPGDGRASQALLETPGGRLQLIEVLRQAATGLLRRFGKGAQVEDPPVA